MRPMMTGEVAKKAGVDSTTVRKWDREQRLRAYRSASGVRVFDADEVEEFLRQREQRDAGRGQTR